MCYTGQCPYEDHAGECCVSGSKYPDDAICVLQYEKTQDQSQEGAKKTYYYYTSPILMRRWSS